MSAITGIFYRDGRKVDPELIKKMNDKLSHRGPDGSNVWYNGSIALGHQMLWTTPESLHEKLPFEDEESGLVITADARIDNRDELSKELNIKDEECVSDSYFIFKAYEKWGEGCPEHLLGDFAFAVWNKNEEKLFCARDHMGVKPFYYYLDDEMFVFGTEIKALFCVPEVPRELNEKRVAFYLMDIEDNRSTFYKNILSLSKAHFLTIKQNDDQIKEYWKLDPNSQIIMESDEDYAQAFREIFGKAVECRLRSAYPLGFELSGGLDSSSVVCMAKKILNQNSSDNLNTFSYVFDNFPQCDESYYIKKVSDTKGIDPHFVFGDEINLLEHMDIILWHQEQPFFTPFIAILWKLYKKMQEKNIRIMLSGLGGDSVISYGTNYFRDLLVSFQWKRLITELNSYSKHLDMSRYNRFFCDVFFPFIFPLIPEYLKRHKYHKTDILNKEFAKKMDVETYLKNIHLIPLKEAKTAKKHHYHLILTDNIYMSEMLDRTTSAFSIEPRYPFLDKRLVEFCYAIPTEIKFKYGWYRYIQRIAMDGILPKENQWRPFKAGLEDIYEKNFLSLESEYLENNILSFNNEIIKEYVDIHFIKDSYQKFKHGNIDRDLFCIWHVLLLFLWLQKNNIHHQNFYLNFKKV